MSVTSSPALIDLFATSSTWLPLMFSLRVFVSQLWLSSRRVGNMAVPTSLKIGRAAHSMRIKFKDRKRRTKTKGSLLILRHRETGNVGFFHFHDLVEVVADSLLHKNQKVVLNSLLKKVKWKYFKDNVTCKWTITPAICFSCADKTAAYGVSFGPK